METASGSVSRPGWGLKPNRTRFDVLPTEILLHILEQLQAHDKINVAFTFPHMFLDSKRINIFVMDAYRQLSIPTYIAASLREEESRRPLILDAVGIRRFSPDRIGYILDQYELVCNREHIDRDTFLNCAIPDNMPKGKNPPPPTERRIVYTPLHAAVLARRPDIIRYLIERGADANRAVQTVPYGTVPAFTPLQFAIWQPGPPPGEFLHIPILETILLTPDDDRAKIEDVGIALAPESSVSAFSDTYLASHEMLTVLNLGYERLAIALIENSTNVDHTSDFFKLQQYTVLKRTLSSRCSAPRLIRYLLNNGAAFSPSATIQPPYHSMITIAIHHRNPENIAAVFSWELENNTHNSQTTIGIVAGFARRDSAIRMTKKLVRRLIRFNHTDGQRLFLRHAIEGRQEARHTRRWLLKRTNAVDGLALACAIDVRDTLTAAIVLDRFRQNARSIESPLADGLEGLDREKGWYYSPLTYAILADNYYEATHLLVLGASPSLVPPHVRQKVYRDWVAISSGHIRDTVRFVFRDSLSNGDVFQPAQNDANRSLRYVFTHVFPDDTWAVPLRRGPGCYFDEVEYRSVILSRDLQRVENGFKQHD